MTFDAYKAPKIASTALELLKREIVLPSLVTTNASGDFKGALNDTINIRVPGRTTARKRALRPANEAARTIQLSDIEERSIPVTLDEDIYSAVGLEDEVATLDLTDFGAQILEPQTRSVGVAWENKIAALLRYAPYKNTLTWSATKPFDTLIDARKLLNDAGVPQNNRVLVVGSAVEALLLKSDQLIRYDSSGDASALKDATLGKIAGFTVVTSLAVPEGHAYVFHKSAFAAAWRAPVVPRGAAFGASVSAPGGLALTYLQDYDAMQSRDRSIVHVYTGANHVADLADPDGETALQVAGGLIRGVKIIITGAGS